MYCKGTRDPSRRPRASVSDASLARRPPSRGDGDQGSVSLIMVILAIGMFAMAGLVIDGGIALAARGRATELAQEAARAGAGALAPGSLRGPRPDLQADPGAATRAAQQILDAGGAHGEVTVSGAEVTVTARVTRRPVMLLAFGVSDLTGSGAATATVLHGTTTGRIG
jgi:hypothetical protein